MSSTECGVEEDEYLCSMPGCGKRLCQVLTASEKKLFLHRAKVDKTVTGLCKKHCTNLITNYAKVQRGCCGPLHVNKTKIKSTRWVHK